MKGDGESAASHRRFYDEYMAVMDLTAEFYLQTIERVFQKHLLAEGKFVYRGERLVKPSAITDIGLMTIEGEKDDISAPGQCLAALDLLTGLPKSKKASHVEPGAGHYGIFAGKSWRNNIRPLVLDFIDQNSDAPAAAPGVPAAAPLSRLAAAACSGQAW